MLPHFLFVGGEAFSVFVTLSAIPPWVEEPFDNIHDIVFATFYDPVGLWVFEDLLKKIQTLSPRFAIFSLPSC